MDRLFGKFSKKIGQPSGTLEFTGEKKTEQVEITILDYDQDDIEETKIESVEECRKYKEKDTVTWINIDGLHKEEVIDEIGSIYDLHPLLLEDILNTQQRPKIEDFDDYIFILLKMIYYDEQEDEIYAEQVSVVFGENFVISFQEKPGDVFSPIRERLKRKKGRIRVNKADYLAYALIDAIVDNYFVILEKLGERIEDIEEELVEDPNTDTLYSIHDMKREMIYLRKSVWPLREVINLLLREESSLIKKSTDIYLRDLYDNTIQIMDTVETFRDMLSSMLDLYLSSISNKMNEVMKVLTIIATIFIPLTFIAGIYGMNFNPAESIYNMPELNWAYGYPATIIVMLIVSVLMIIYFRGKDWL